MAERTPPTAAIKQAWIVGHPFRATTTVEEREAEFDRWLAEVRREAEARGYEAGYRRGYRDRRLEKSFNPHQEETA